MSPRADGSIVIDTKILEGGFHRGLGSLKRAAKMGGLAIGAGVALATTAIIAFGVSSMKAGGKASIARRRIAQIAQSMGVAGDNAEGFTKRLTDLAEATALETGVSNLSIKAVQAKLLTFKELAKTSGEVGKQFDRTTNAAIDLAAAGFGEAESNATQLGKALQDPIKGVTALARAGVTFTAQEKKKMKALVESGKMLEAQDYMLKAIEKQVGGTAKATASSTAKIKESYAQLKEAAGGPLSQALGAIAPSIVKGLQSLKPAMTQTFQGVADILTGKGGPMQKAMAGKQLGEGVAKLAKSLLNALNGALPAIVTALSTLIVSVANAIAPLLPTIATALGQGVSTLAAALPSFIPALVQGLVGVIQALVAVAPSIITSLVTALVAGLSAIVAVMPTIIPALIGGFVKVILALVAALPALLPVIVKGFVVLLMALAAVLPTVIPALIGGFVGLITAIAGMLPTLLPVLLNGFIMLITAVASMLPTIIPVLVNAIVTIITALASAIGPMLPVIVSAVLKLIPLLVVAAMRIAIALATALIANLPKLARAGQTLMRGLVTAVKTGIKGFPAIGRAISDGIKNGVSVAWGKLVAKLKGLVALLPAIVKKMLGIKSPSRVFAELGKNIALGLSGGIDSNASRVSASIASLASTVTDGMSGIGQVASQVFDTEMRVAASVASAPALSLGAGAIAASMRKSVTSEMGRFSAAVAPARAAAPSTSQPQSTGDNIINFNQPVRTYAEVIRARRDIEKGVAF